MDLLAGVDIGTTQLKVGVFDMGGACHAVAARPCPPDYHADGRIEIDTETWWRAFLDAFDECRQSVDQASLRAVGVSSQAQTYVLLDPDGRPTGPAISWLDMRGDRQGMTQSLAGEDIYTHTGLPEAVRGITSCKLRELGESDGAWTGIAGLLFPDGALMHRLTGARAVSRNLASMSGLYSMVDHDWWAPALAGARVTRDVLPRLCDMGEPAGELRADVAEQFDMPVVPVVAGANDQTVAALGAGLTQPGEASLGMGTALVLYQVIESNAAPTTGFPFRGPYPGGLHWQLGLCSTAGAVVEWVRNMLMPDASWDAFYDAGLSVEPGARGLRLDPHWDIEGGGALDGIVLGHRRGDIIRAALEGVACEARRQLDDFGVNTVVRATGGGCQHDGWMQLLADVTGRAFDRLDQTHGGLWGTAMMAAHGAGLCDDMLAMARETACEGTCFEPSDACAEVYAKVYEESLR